MKWTTTQTKNYLRDYDATVDDFWVTVAPGIFPSTLDKSTPVKAFTAGGI